MRSIPLAVTAAALVAAVPAHAQIRTLFTGAAGLPTSQVPGAPGSIFNDSAFSQTVFDRPFVSPDGSFFGFKGDLEGSPFFDDVIVVAPLANPSAGVAFVESTPVPGGPADLLTNQFDSRVSILDDGSFAFTTNARVGTSSAQGDRLIAYDAGTMTFTEALTAGSSLGGGTISPGTGINSPYLAPGGGIGAQVVLDGPGNVVAFGPTILAAEGDQPAGAPAPTTIFEFQETFFSDGGTGFLTQARSFPGSNTIDATLVDGSPVIVGGQVLPGSGFASVVSDTAPPSNGSGMNEAGVWWARGSNGDGTEWAVVDGGLVAVEGDSAFGTAETWSEIDGVSADSLGNYIVLGETSAGDDVLVYNGSLLLARSGDATDLAGFTIRDFQPNDLVLSDAGEAIIAARLLENGSAAGHSLLAVAIPEPATAGLLGVAGLALLRRRR